MEQAQSNPRIGYGMGAVILVMIIIAVAALLALCAATGITSIYASFLFVLYWTGVNHGKPEEFWPALCGAFMGLFLAWTIKTFPVAFGPVVGTAAMLGLIMIAVFFLIVGRLSLIFNSSAMLYLTILSIPQLLQTENFLEVAAAIAVGAVYCAAIRFLLVRGFAMWSARGAKRGDTSARASHAAQSPLS